MTQATSNIIMIRPISFDYNKETAVNNYYQKELNNFKSSEIQEKAISEFDSFVEKLRDIGVNVFVFNDNNKYHTPDSIFPNNWLSFHLDGTVVIYPMFAHNRRLERRDDILDTLQTQFKFEINRIVDFSHYEKKRCFLEGTGSMVLDRTNKICYAALSVRTDKKLVHNFCESLNYKPICFTANQTINSNRMPIYHTNVMMCVADRFVVICIESIDDEVERSLVVNQIRKTNKEIIEISEIQKTSFAGNMLEVFTDKSYLVMSSSAHKSLNQHQIRSISKYSSIVSIPLNVIESCGGGSARCMMAEIFLSKKND